MKKKTEKTWQAWTMLEVRYLKRHFEDKTIQEIALHLKRRYESVRLKAFYLALRKVHQWTAQELDFIRDNFRTMSDKEIGDRLNLTAAQIKGKRSYLGWRKYRNKGKN